MALSAIRGDPVGYITCCIYLAAGSSTLGVARAQGVVISPSVSCDTGNSDYHRRPPVLVVGEEGC